MNRLARNEGLKLFAGWLNSLSVATIGAGVLAPIAYQVYAADTRRGDFAVIAIFALGCVSLGLILHLAAQFVIGRLSDDP